MKDLIPGTASDELPEVLATGRCGVSTIFTSMSARHPEGRDADFLTWHTIDHRPEQHRLAALRASLRLVSTPACRAARAASNPRYDAVDHVMTYLFADVAGLQGFIDLADALRNGGRIPYLLPSVERAVYRLDGAAAAQRIKAGADVLPWWPAKGIYLLIERGTSAPPEFIDAPGVGGAWWGTGLSLLVPYATAPNDGLQITYYFLDGEPAQTAERLRPMLAKRWSRFGLEPLLAAPFHVLNPYDLDRFLP